MICFTISLTNAPMALPAIMLPKPLPAGSGGGWTLGGGRGGWTLAATTPTWGGTTCGCWTDDDPKTHSQWKLNMQMAQL